MKLSFHLSRQQTFGLIVGVCTVALLIVGGGAAFAYGVYARQWDTPFVRRVAALVRLPAARVGSHVITYTEYLTHLDAEKRFLQGPAAQAEGLSGEPTADDRKSVLDRTIRIATVEELAAQNGLVVTPLDVDRTYDELVARAGTSTTPQEIQTFLMDQFGWTEADFKQYVVRPAMLEDGARQAFERRAATTTDATAFDKELEAKLTGPEVKRYLKL